MRNIIPIYRLLIVINLMLYQAFAQVEPDPPFVSLFNGTDLASWSVKCRSADSSKEYWTVEEETIQVDAIPGHDYMWLYTDNEYGDFILQLKFQAFQSSPGNSGVQIRSRYDLNDGGGWLNGPQIDIHPHGTYRIGYVYDETRGYQRWIHPDAPNSTFPANLIDGVPQAEFYWSNEGDGWNSLLISFIGMKIKTVFNGVVRTDWDATGIMDDNIHKNLGVSDRAHIALQLHTGDELLMRFKDIYIYDIDADVTPPEVLENFSAATISPTQIDCSWGRVTGDAGADSIVIRYRSDGSFPADENDGTLYAALPASDTTVSLTGLTENTTYHISAFISDIAGNWSNAASDSAVARDPSSVRYRNGTLAISPDLQVDLYAPDGRLLERFNAGISYFHTQIEPGLYLLVIREGARIQYRKLVALAGK
jgi:hypothetical protein